ncbi:hypothetical protein GMES_2826 [Paraglaciecola mesophila KMM 241]|uniref:Uncharacterized protein n=1 Tax=Paraglaciecola mesophila KMM 241 TaxID=1128912 RepID=K6YM80_9ALTE|nr:hypothetical protein GMES_2826 [Paraglaciecola mesophila KMM 241]
MEITQACARTGRLNEKCIIVLFLNYQKYISPSSWRTVFD